MDHGPHPSGTDCSNTSGSYHQASCSAMGSSLWAASLAQSLLLPHGLFQARSICSTMDSSTGCSAEICSVLVLPWAVGEQLAPPGVSLWAAEELLLWCLEHLLPYSCTDIVGPQGYFSVISLSSLSAAVVQHLFFSLS